MSHDSALPDGITSRHDPFLDEVFPAELEEIRRRRLNAGDRRRLPESSQDVEPDVDLDLTGLALSGGGIRSAAFGLGVVQTLIKEGLLKRFDYISTVSGGGFIGSCLSTLMHDDGVDSPSGAELLRSDPNDAKRSRQSGQERKAREQPPALRHLRNGSNYLVPPGKFSAFRLPALVLIGFLQILVLALPVVVGCVLATELLFALAAETWKAGDLGVARWLPALSATPLLIAAIWRPFWRAVRPKTHEWPRRNRGDQRLGLWLVVALVGLAGVPIFAMLEWIVDLDAQAVGGAIDDWFEQQLGYGVTGRLFWIVAAVVLGGLYCFVRFRKRFLLSLFGALGPLILGGLYVFLCVVAIDSPVASLDGYPELRLALEAKGPVDWDAQVEIDGAGPKEANERRTVRDQLASLLWSKGVDLAEYIPPTGDREAGESVEWIRRAGLPAPPVHRRLTVAGRRTLTVELVGFTAASDGESAGAVESRSAGMIFIPQLSMLEGNAEWWLYLLAAVVFLFNLFLTDVNQVSHNAFYRDRLSGTFLIAPAARGVRRLIRRDDIKLSELCGRESSAPYHLLNAALNLQGSASPDLRDRRTEPFLMSKRYCGSSATGYCRTEDLEAEDVCMNLGTAMAISAAAAAPNRGTETSAQLTMAMTILNIRVGYWLPNPAAVRIRACTSEMAAGLDGGLWGHLARGRTYVARKSRPGLGLVGREALGLLDERGSYVNTTDGGYIENLGVYELLRRHCKTIVCVDAEEDADFQFKGLTTLQRYANIDLDTVIHIDLDGIRACKEDWRSPENAPWTIGTIEYPDHSEGKLIYIKLGMIGDTPVTDLPEYIVRYAAGSKAFPHEPTSNQFFGETQFEVYRRLGREIAKHAFHPGETEESPRSPARALLGSGGTKAKGKPRSRASRRRRP